MGVLTAMRARPIALIVGVAAAALLMVALAPGTANAACKSSTPASASFPDVPGGAGTAPDVLSVDVSLDGACRLTVDPKLQASLSVNQSVLIELGFGPPPDELVDRDILTLPGGPPFLFDADSNLIGALTPHQQAGFSATLDELGLAVPTSLGIYVFSAYDDPGVIGDETFDEVADVGGTFFRLPVSFTPSPPSPPPPPPPPPSLPPPPPAPAATKKATGCKVPKLKGLTVKKAKAALKKAGCKYKLKGKGRVRSFSPKAGTTTDATVQVKCKKKKRKKRSRSSVLRVAHDR